MVTKKQLAQKQIETLIELLKDRFENNSYRHKGIEWLSVQTKLIKLS